MPQSPPLPDNLTETRFADLQGWADDDHLATLKSFIRFCEKPEAFAGGPESLTLASEGLETLCKAASGALTNGSSARAFFENNFSPFKVAQSGFVTGYFEPEVAASTQKTDQYATPLHRKPVGLETITESNRPADWPGHLSHGRRIDSKFEEMPDRRAIMEGALDEENLEFVWLQDPIDAYYIHVQGSARLRLTDGSTMRVGYAGKTGHPYTGIGRLLVKRGEGTPDDFTMAGLRGWLKTNPDQRDALFKENQSYIFFRKVTETRREDGPVGAAGLPLVPGRSLAVDNDHIPYGSLVFVTSDFQYPEKKAGAFQRLMVADDTGSAINGPSRGDVFVGSGDAAGNIAGEIHHSAEFTVLVPNKILANSPTVTD
ncbi:MAG: MltA domain-containing protein [Roseibium sp.]